MEEIKIFDDERLDIVNDGIKLIQRKQGLVFGSDALLLGGYIKGNQNAKCAELGGGTGIISLLTAKRNKAKTVYIYEIQPQFAELCQRNAALNRLDDKIVVLNKDIRESGALDCGGEVDFVFSNPPYMKMGCGRENAVSEKNIARRETAGDIFDFCRAASRLLKYGGSFYVVYLPERLNELTTALTEGKLEPKRLTLICPDMNKRPCLVLIEAKKGGGKGMLVTPPLYIKLNGDESPDYRYIMENGDFNELYKKV
jgi:tRNA1Val (adenine37-N6)-methyltransferase